MKQVIVSYDITSNKTRRKMANMLIYHGMYRMQYSVFVGTIDIYSYNAILDMVDTMIQEPDKCAIINLTKTNLENIKIYGDNSLSLDEITGSKKYLYFG